MTVYALRLENDTDTAARVRVGDLLGLTPAGALTARTGVRPGPAAGDVAVDAGTMNVTVQPFLAWVQGGASDTQGGYPFVCDDEVVLAISNGHATLTRVDVIAAVVHDDPFDGSGLVDAGVVVIVGTPGAGVPALPDNCLPLRNISVHATASAGTGGLSGANLSTDRRTYLSSLGGVVPVASATERDALLQTAGTIVYRSDTDRLEVLRAAGWGAWSTFTPTYTTETGAVDATGTMRYRLTLDNVLQWSLNVTVLDNFVDPVTNGFRFTLPVPSHASAEHLGTGRESQSSGALLHVTRVSASLAQVKKYNEATVGSPSILNLSGAYEPA